VRGPLVAPRPVLGPAGGFLGWRADLLRLYLGWFHGAHLAGARLPLAPAAHAAGRRGLLLYVDHDHRDVVVAAGVEGRGEKISRRSLGVLRRTEHELRDPRFGDHVRKPVRAQEHAVARLYGEHGGVDGDVLVGPQGPGDEVFLRVLGRLVPGQVAATDQLGDERVVLG
jgi:hypothetical protein